MRNYLTVVAGLVILTGCAAERAPEARVVGRAPAREAEPKERPALLVSGAGVAQGELTPRLAEAAGAVVIEEVVLSRLLDEQVATLGLSVSQADVEAEQKQLEATIAEEAKMSPDQVLAAVKRLRQERGLGPTRFTDLMARNAKLRALVRAGGPQEPSVEEVDQAIAVEFGPRLRVRMITSPTDRRASEVREQLFKQLTPVDATASVTRFLNSKFVTSMRFAEVASQSSSDLSASRGGLVDPVSLSDLGLPPAVRNALKGMEPGELSPILSTERGYAMFLLEEKIPGRGATPEERTRVEARLRARKERIAMDRVARELLARAKVNVLDASLNWSWEGRPRQ